MQTLRTIRKKLLLKEAAEKLGTSTSMLSLIEHGKRGLSAEMVEQMSALYKVNPSTVLAAYRSTKEQVG